MAAEAFIKCFMPILFATVAQTANCATVWPGDYYYMDFDDINTNDWGNVFLTNTITIGIAVIFVLPDITNDSNSFDHNISYNEVKKRRSKHLFGLPARPLNPIELTHPLHPN